MCEKNIFINIKFIFKYRKKQAKCVQHYVFGRQREHQHEFLFSELKKLLNCEPFLYYIDVIGEVLMLN
jgi:hypothetical protein